MKITDIHIISRVITPGGVILAHWLRNLGGFTFTTGNGFIEVKKHGVDTVYIPLSNIGAICGTGIIDDGKETESGTKRKDGGHDTRTRKKAPKRVQKTPGRERGDVPTE